MSEGYYEEPMKWTMRNNTYENQRRDAESDYRENRPPKAPKLEKFYRLYEMPKITNATILLVSVASSIISLICLVVLVQSSQESKNDFSTIRRILSEVKNNVTATKTPTTTTVLPTTTAAPEFPNNDTCRVYYKEKCFRLVSWTNNITLSEARDECTKVGGKLANVYDFNHFEQISELLKESLSDNIQVVSAWTGMTIDTKTRRIILSDFTSPSGGIPWYPWGVYSSKLPYITIKIRSSKNLYARGLYDVRSRERFHTAICEIAKEPCPD